MGSTIKLIVSKRKTDTSGNYLTTQYKDFTLRRPSRVLIELFFDLYEEELKQENDSMIKFGKKEWISKNKLKV